MHQQIAFSSMRCRPRPIYLWKALPVSIAPDQPATLSPSCFLLPGWAVCFIIKHHVFGTLYFRTLAKEPLPISFNGSEIRNTIWRTSPKRFNDTPRQGRQWKFTVSKYLGRLTLLKPLARPTLLLRHFRRVHKISPPASASAETAWRRPLRGCQGQVRSCPQRE